MDDEKEQCEAGSEYAMLLELSCCKGSKMSVEINVNKSSSVVNEQLLKPVNSNAESFYSASETLADSKASSKDTLDVIVGGKNGSSESLAQQSENVLPAKQSKKDKILGGLKSALSTVQSFVSNKKASLTNSLPSSLKIKNSLSQLKPSLTGVKNSASKIASALNSAASAVGQKGGEIVSSVKNVIKNIGAAISGSVKSVYAKVIKK